MSEFNCEVLKMIQDDEIDERHRLQARIVSWNKGKPQFELRPMHLKNGKWMHGQHIVKCKEDMLNEIIESGILIKAYEAFKEMKDGKK